MPRVSVIIPAFNAEAFLARALHSVEAQTYRDYEVVLIDDGSTDSTAEIARSFKIVRYFHQSNQHQAVARNRGLKEAEGELIAFLDADDEWLPEKLERQLALMEGNESRISYTDTYYAKDGKRVRYSKLAPPWEGQILKPLVEEWLEFCFITMNTVVADKRLLEEVGGFDEAAPFSSFEDYGLWLRVALSEARFDYLDEPLAIYHRGYASDSSDRISMHERYLEALEHFDSSYELPPEARSQVISTLNRTNAALGRMLLQQGRLREAAPHLRRVAPDSLRHRLLRATGRVLSLFVRPK